MSKTYTFDLRFVAHTMSRTETVYIPDQVAEAQREYDGKTFPVLRQDGRKARAELRGDEYGLWTPGTGTPVVAIC